MDLKRNADFIVLSFILLICLVINMLMNKNIKPVTLYACTPEIGCTAVYKFKTFEECRKHLSKDNYCSFIEH